MIDLMMSAEQDAATFLERLTGGPMEDDECMDSFSDNAFFAMAGSAQLAAEAAQRAPR